jgi:hypothetical protein
MKYDKRSMARAVAVVVAIVVAGHGSVKAEVAATGTFGIDVDVPFPFTSGTFNGQITNFDAGPFSVGGTGVDLGTGVGGMGITNGVISAINLNALAASFSFTLADQGGTLNMLSITGAGRAVCTDAITCAQGQGTFVADVSGATDPNDLLPDAPKYVFDGTVTVSSGMFDATGVFGLNAFSPLDVPAGLNVIVQGTDEEFFDSRKNTLRNFLIDLTFAGVTNPGTLTILGKSAVPGTLPANISVDADESVIVDIVTGNGLAFTPPVTVCVAYKDVDDDGIVDGTSLHTNELKLLHALALGENFQDVTTTTDGGKVCGQVDQLSPFMVAKGPAPVVTTTTVTTTTTLAPVPPTTTTLPERLAGKKLLLKDKAGKPQKRALMCLATGITLGGGNQSDDDPVVKGGVLAVHGNGLDVAYELPASGWKYQGKAGQNKGYKFKGSRAIKSVVVKKDKLLSIVGKGDGLGQDLTANPAPVQLKLTLGGRKYCLEFGGTVQFKAGTKLLAKSAPAPAVCSPSGAFVE